MVVIVVFVTGGKIPAVHRASPVSVFVAVVVIVDRAVVVVCDCDTVVGDADDDDDNNNAFVDETYLDYHRGKQRVYWVVERSAIGSAYPCL